MLDEKVNEAYKLFVNDTAVIRDGVSAYVYRLGLHPITLTVLTLLAVITSPRLFMQMLFPLLGCWLLVELYWFRTQCEAVRIRFESERSCK